MTTDEQYVPDEEQVRAWCREGTGDYPDVMDEWLDRFLARVRRDAERAALDGLAAKARRKAAEAVVDGSLAAPGLRVVYRAAEDYRDTHYPEETP